MFSLGKTTFFIKSTTFKSFYTMPFLQHLGQLYVSNTKFVQFIFLIFLRAILTGDRRKIFLQLFLYFERGLQRSVT